MCYDPTFEISRREYGAHPERDEYAELLSIGCEPSEAAMILDSELLSFDEWTEMYGEEAANERMVCTPPIATERA